LCAKGGEISYQGPIFHSKYLFLAIHAKGGESISPKQKDRTTTLILKDFFKLVSYCVKKGKKIAPSKNDILKPFWTLRGGIYWGGVLFKSKEKHLKQGEKISNLENASQNLIHLPLTIYKRILKRIYKRICKNKTSGASVVQNVENKETIHAYLMSIYIGSILSNLCTYNYAN
jgi:hypothetical protein